MFNLRVVWQSVLGVVVMREWDNSLVDGNDSLGQRNDSVTELIIIIIIIKEHL